MWSIATEWQIYFFFPSLVLLSRKRGIAFTVVVATVVGLAPHFFLSGWLDWAHPWYLGLFAAGMAACVYGINARRFQGTVPTARPLRWATAFLCLLVIALLALSESSSLPTWLIDLAVGAATACTLGLCAWATGISRSKSMAMESWILRLLETPTLVGLGAFSYSLYLVHFPILSWLHFHLKSWGIGPDVRLLTLLTAGTALCVAVSYVFHRMFERPSLNAHPTTCRSK
jgi:peptidoglycan/LPS O-acetylase OafA/YrhL